MKQVLIATIVAVLLLGCSDDDVDQGDTGVSSKVDFGAGDLGPAPGAPQVAVARESQAMGQVRLEVAGLVGLLQAHATARDLLEGKDVFGASNPDGGVGSSSGGGCLSVIKDAKAKALMLSFSCPKVRGTVTMTPKGVIGSRYVQAQIGGATGPMTMGNLGIKGYLRLSRKLLGSYDVATCGGKCGSGEYYKQGDACKKGSKICLEVTPKSSEKAAHVGFYGQAKREVKAAAKSVQVTFSGAGSIYREPDSERTMKTGSDAGPPAMPGLLQVMEFGANAKAETCGSGGLSGAKGLVFDVPADLSKLTCVCPTAGTISASGDVWADVGLDCDKDARADMVVTVLYKTAGEELTFATSCGASSGGTTFCAKEGKARFRDADLRHCGGVRKAMCALSGVKSTLGCEDDHCSICHKEVDLASLKKAVADWKTKHAAHDWSRLEQLVSHLISTDGALKAKVTSALAGFCKK